MRQTHPASAPPSIVQLDDRHRQAVALAFGGRQRSGQLGEGFGGRFGGCGAAQRFGTIAERARTRYRRFLNGWYGVA